MKYATPIDGWSAYYALLTDALSARPTPLIETARRAPETARRAPAPQRPRRSLLERLDHWFADQRERQRERYLAQATDLCDLESRMRELNRYY